MIFEVPGAPLLAERLSAEVDVLAIGPARMRAVTHLDVDRAQIDSALQAFAAAL